MDADASDASGTPDASVLEAEPPSTAPPSTEGPDDDEEEHAPTTAAHATAIQ
jgi:hypothetical protein